MEALQRMMTKRLDEHSYKRTAKRLVVDECINDVDFYEKSELAKMNPIYDICKSGTIRTRKNLKNSTTGQTFLATTYPITNSSNSISNLELTSNVTSTTINDDHTHDDKLLRKIALAVRKKLTGAKSLVSEYNSSKVNNYDKNSNCNDSKNNQRNAENDTEKQLRLKSAKKVIYLIDLCTISRKHRGEHRKLLNEEHDDE